MEIIVQKFGGTSVASPELRDKIAKKAIAAIEAGKHPVIVVSAIGRNGDPYATDTLINLLNNNENNIYNRNRDLLMSCGEIISAVILSNLINKYGYKSVALTGYQAGIITNDNFNSSSVIRVDKKKVLAYLQDGFIPVVTGFQGITEEGEITTLGRGGSDTTASVMGEALGAELIEIYTDVDGIMTADPRYIKDANVIDALCYDEVYQLAKSGAKVIHPRAVEIAERCNIPLVIKNTLNDSKGTMITSKKRLNTSIVEPTNNRKLVTAITNKNDIAQVQITIDAEDSRNQILLYRLTFNDISIDMINFFKDKKVFTIDMDKVNSLKCILDELEIDYKIFEKCSMITILGYKIHGVPGVMARIATTLSNNKITILQSSDSHTTISCLVDTNTALKAVEVLHNEFM